MPPRHRAVLASNNAHKLAELQRLLTPLAVDLVPMAALDIPSPPEDGLSFIENSLLKARHAAGIAGLPAIADDSGLAVDALDGAPGIYSARYAGESATDQDNNQKLLAALGTTRNRSAAFHCCLSLVRHAADPIPVIACGAWQGSIAERPRGTNGFGYDPLFIDRLDGKSAAELTESEKGVRSHRGRAMQQFLAMITSDDFAPH